MLDVELIDVARNREKWQAFVKAVMKLRVP